MQVKVSRKPRPIHAAKVAVALASLVVLAVPLCVTASWWLSTSRYTTRVQTNGFTYAGWMPLAVGVFAFAIATLIGTVLRRPGWTIATALAIMVLVTWTMQTEVRTHLVPLRSVTVEMTTLTKGGATFEVPLKMAPTSAWVVFDGLVPLHWSGALPTWPEEAPWLHEANRCSMSTTSKPNNYATCLHKSHLKNIELYVSNSEYWTLQLREGALYLGGAVLLLGVSLILVRRTRT